MIAHLFSDHNPADVATLALILTLMLTLAIAAWWPARRRAVQRHIAQMPSSELLARCRFDGPPGAELNAYAQEYLRRLEQHTGRSS
jgi:hypothetical protein